MKRSDELILIGTYFSEEWRDDPIPLLQNGHYQVLGFYLLMPESFGQLLRSLDDLLCLQGEFIKSHI